MIAKEMTNKAKDQGKTENAVECEMKTQAVWTGGQLALSGLAQRRKS